MLLLAGIWWVKNGVEVKHSKQFTSQHNHCIVRFIISTLQNFYHVVGSIPQFIGSELFKQGPRPAAMSFAGLMNWVANFIVGISFPFIQVPNMHNLKLSKSCNSI